MFGAFRNLGTEAAHGTAAPINVGLKAYDLTVEGVALSSVQVYEVYAKAHNEAIRGAPEGSALSLAKLIGESSKEGGFTANASKVAACIGAANAVKAKGGDPISFRMQALKTAAGSSGNSYENLLKIFRQQKDAKDVLGLAMIEAIISGEDTRTDEEKERDTLKGVKEKRAKDMQDHIEDAIKRVLSAEDKLGLPANKSLTTALQDLKALAMREFPRA